MKLSPGLMSFKSDFEYDAMFQQRVANQALQEVKLRFFNRGFAIGDSVSLEDFDPIMIFVRW